MCILRKYIRLFLQIQVPIGEKVSLSVKVQLFFPIVLCSVKQGILWHFFQLTSIHSCLAQDYIFTRSLQVIKFIKGQMNSRWTYQSSMITHKQYVFLAHGLTQTFGFFLDSRQSVIFMKRIPIVKWDFGNANFVKNDTLKRKWILSGMRILSKMRLLLE